MPSLWTNDHLLKIILIPSNIIFFVKNYFLTTVDSENQELRTLTVFSSTSEHLEVFQHNLSFREETLASELSL